MIKKEEKFKKDLDFFIEKIHNKESVGIDILTHIYDMNRGMFATNKNGEGLGFYPVGNGIVFNFFKKNKGDTFKIIETRMLTTDNWTVIHLKKAIDMSKELDRDNEVDINYIG